MWHKFQNGAQIVEITQIIQKAINYKIWRKLHCWAQIAQLGTNCSNKRKLLYLAGTNNITGHKFFKHLKMQHMIQIFQKDVSYKTWGKLFYWAQNAKFGTNRPFQNQLFK